MTKAELIQALENYGDDDEVVLGVEGFDEWLTIDEVSTYDRFGYITISNQNKPSRYSLETYAESYYNIANDMVSDEKEAFDNWRDMI